MTRVSTKAVVLGGVAVTMLVLSVTDVDAGWRRRSFRNRCCEPVVYQHHHHDACGCQPAVVNPCGAPAGCPCGTATTFAPATGATEYSAARPIHPDGQIAPVPAEGYQPPHANPNWREGALQDNRATPQRNLNEERREMNRELNDAQRDLNRDVNETRRDLQIDPNLDAEAAADVNAALQANP